MGDVGSITAGVHHQDLVRCLVWMLHAGLIARTSSSLATAAQWACHAGDGRHLRHHTCRDHSHPEAGMPFSWTGAAIPKVDSILIVHVVVAVENGDHRYL